MIKEMLDALLCTDICESCQAKRLNPNLCKKLNCYHCFGFIRKKRKEILEKIGWGIAADSSAALQIFKT